MTPRLLILLAVLCLFGPPKATAQKKNLFVLDGRASTDRNVSEGIRITIFNETDNKALPGIDLDDRGYFHITLSYQKKYLVGFQYEGYFTKIFEVSTIVPEEVWSVDPYFKPFRFQVILHPAVEGLHPEFSRKPIAKIHYSKDVDGFMAEAIYSDKKIHHQIEKAVAENIERKVDAQLARAEEYQTQGQWALAMAAIKQAKDLDPRDSDLKKKIRDAEKEVKSNEKEPDTSKQQYAMYISEGDTRFNEKSFDDAKSAYQKALKLVPGDSLAQAKLRLVDEHLQAMADEKARLFAEAAAKDKAFSQAMNKADSLFGLKEYPNAKLAYQQALKILPSSEEPHRQIAEINRLIARNASLAAAFTGAVSRGNQQLEAKNYRSAVDIFNEALSMKPDDATVTALRDSASVLLKNQQEQQRALAEARAKEEHFRSLMEQGDQAFAAASYEQAANFFGQAYSLKKDSVAREKGLKAQHMLNQQQLAAASQSSAPSVVSTVASKPTHVSTDYQKQITQAEQAFKRGEWSGARFYYFEALKEKPGDAYAEKQVNECDKLIAAHITADMQQKYLAFIANGDNSFLQENYANARLNYRKALDIKPWEKYPRRKMEAIDRAMQDWKSDEQRRQFTAAIEKADDAFDKGEYAVARFYYRRAANIKADTVADERLKEIASIIAGARQSSIDNLYKEEIRKADTAFHQKNPTVARFYYQKALQLKPDETYPQEQLKKIQAAD
ncbi:hypothetical protein PbJCM13498_06770 [Prolixibacter bellariivorans]|uniref:Tetratricopeptide repeat protein n=1 Tax=Prolixibacter bellariivorans TaxID=314319 RepID=A0A5M4AVJ3_9BACT|nr:hypothetical protein [Prolixibacter bellariivorans]GET31814.1 hypothetical protein PbJCM13498_06770 [Prolixibacter bellariivorans]